MGMAVNMAVTRTTLAQRIKPNLVHGLEGVNHAIVFEFLKYAVHRGLVDLIGQSIKQHAGRECVARLAKRLEHLLEVFGFSENAHGLKLTQLGCDNVLRL